MRRLIYDIETSPNIGLFWRTGYNISVSPDNIIHERKIITIAWKWHGEKKVHALDWGTKQDDKPMLEAFIPILNEADEAVAHFGDSFDLPWIKGRCLIHGIPTFPKYVTIDTKQWASRYFQFNSNKLDYLSKLFGRKGKIHTDFDLWKKIVLENDQRALRYMVKYNKGDVVELEYVYDKMAAVVPHRTHQGVLSGGEKWHCAQCGSKNVNTSKTRVTARGTKQFQMQCNKGHYYTISEKAYQDYLAKK